MNGSRAYVRDRYGVPAHRGARVRLGSLFGKELAGRTGTITSATDGYIRVRLDGTASTRAPHFFHPTWEIEYLPAGDRHAVPA